MALRGIQEYIARDVNNIARVEDIMRVRLNNVRSFKYTLVNISTGADGVYLSQTG